MKSLLFSFEGRIRRGLYFKGGLIIFSVLMVLAVLDMALGTFDMEAGVGLISGLGLLVALWPTLALQVKRLHDLGHSGWMALITLFPIVNFFFGLYLLFAPGKAEPNRFGVRTA